MPDPFDGLRARISQQSQSRCVLMGLHPRWVINNVLEGRLAHRASLDGFNMDEHPVSIHCG